MKPLLGTAVFLFIFLFQTEAADPDQGKTLEELVLARGFKLQTHTVLTDDDYILKVHRVVPQDYDATTYSIQRKPVIAFHGLLCDSSIFFLNSPCQPADATNCKDNFGFRMVLEGKYDLWLPNARGNGVSDGHLQYDSESLIDNRYWKFSWEQIGTEDLPAVIEYVLDFTGHQTLGYIGYSQGGGSAVAMLTLEPEQAQYIKPFIGWAPSVYLGNIPSVTRDPLILLAPALRAAPGEFVVTEQWLNDALTGVCQPIAGIDLLPQVCDALLQQIFGASSSANETRIPVYTSFFPTPASNWQMAHFGQLFGNGRFARFDYGLGGNVLKYGTISPPDYRLGQIPKDFRFIVINGRTDALVTATNTALLVSTLRTLGMTNVEQLIVNKAQWSHLDFVAGEGAGSLVYDQTIAYLDKYVVKDGPVGPADGGVKKMEKRKKKEKKLEV